MANSALPGICKVNNYIETGFLIMVFLTMDKRDLEKRREEEKRDR
jgi:hypothetical protein